MTAKLKRGLLPLLAIGLLFIVFSCKNETDIKRKLIARKWAYEKFKMNNDSMTGQQLGNPWMEFDGNGKYKAQMGSRLEEGEWRIEKDKLFTQANDAKKENSLQIKELTAERLILFSEPGGNRATLILIPAGD